MNQSKLTVNALGKKCPLPIIELSRALKRNSRAEIFILLSDDPATEPDLVAWGRMTGNQISKIGDNEFEVKPN